MTSKKSIQLIRENTQSEENFLNIQSVLLYEKIVSITATQREIIKIRDKVEKQFDQVEDNLNKSFNECMKEWYKVSDRKAEKNKDESRTDELSQNENKQ